MSDPTPVPLTFAPVDVRELLWGVVASAGHKPRRLFGPRWAFVSDTCGTGSTYAQRLCRELGFDPDEIVGDLAAADGPNGPYNFLARIAREEDGYIPLLTEMEEAFARKDERRQWVDVDEGSWTDDAGETCTGLTASLTDLGRSVLDSARRFGKVSQD